MLGYDRTKNWWYQVERSKTHFDSGEVRAIAKVLAMRNGDVADREAVRIFVELSRALGWPVVVESDQDLDSEGP